MFHTLKPTLFILAIVTIFATASVQHVQAEAPLAKATGVVAAATTPNKPVGSNYNGKCQDANIDKTNCGIIAYLLTGINVLSALVGVVVVLMIAVGGIQYSASRDNPQATAAAKDRIRNAIIALILYVFMWAFLQYLIPGGVL